MLFSIKSLGTKRYRLLCGLTLLGLCVYLLWKDTLPPAVGLTLAKYRYVEGEPVLANLVIKNRCGSEIDVPYPDFNQRGLSGDLHVRGTINFDTPRLAPYSFGSIEWDEIHVDPRTVSDEIPVDLADYLGRLKPGDYEIHYHVVIPYWRKPQIHDLCHDILTQGMAKIGVSMARKGRLVDAQGQVTVQRQMEAEGDLVFTIEPQLK